MKRYGPGWGGIEPEDDGDYVEYAEAAARIAAMEAALREAEAYIEACLDEADGRAPGGYLVLRTIYAALAPAPAQEEEAFDYSELNGDTSEPLGGGE